MLSLLTSTSVADLISTQNLISFQWDGGLDTALLTLTQRHILSAPVLSPSIGGFCAFVDLADFLVYLTEQIQENEVIEGVGRLIEIAKRHKVGDLLDLSLRNPWLPTQATTSAINAMVLMCSNEAHRIPIGIAFS